MESYFYFINISKLVPSTVLSSNPLPVRLINFVHADTQLTIHIHKSSYTYT